MSKAKKPAAKKKATKAKARKKPQKVTMYLVVRDCFDASPYDGISYPRPTNDDGERESVVPVRAFATKKDAEEYARQCDEEVQLTFAPPLFTGEDTDDENTFGAKVAATVKALGLPAFQPGKYDYESGERFRKWWAEHAADMSHEQRAALWEPFAGMTFHRVKEIELEG